MENNIKIISIKKLKKIGMYELTTSVDTIEVSDDIIVKFRLEKDQEIDASLYKKIKKENDQRNIFFKVCNYISYGMRSEYEIYKYLEERDVSQADIIKIIKELKDLNMVDDEMLARFILDSTIRNKKGPKVFYNKLFERKLKINKDDFIYDEDMELEVLDTVIPKLVGKKTNLPVKKQKEQLYQKLLRDGFSGSLIEKKINSISFTSNALDYLDDEIKKLKKKYEKLPDEEKNVKIIQSLMRKGYEYSDIKKVIF